MIFQKTLLTIFEKLLLKLKGLTLLSVFSQLRFQLRICSCATKHTSNLSFAQTAKTNMEKRTVFIILISCIGVAIGVSVIWYLGKICNQKNINETIEKPSGQF